MLRPSNSTPGVPGSKASTREPIEKEHLDLDIAFAVPFVHRLRTTEEVSGDDFETLLDVLRPGSVGP